MANEKPKKKRKILKTADFYLTAASLKRKEMLTTKDVKFPLPFQIQQESPGEANVEGEKENEDKKEE